MDLGMISSRLESGSFYRAKEMMVADLMLMVSIGGCGLRGADPMWPGVQCQELQWPWLRSIRSGGEY